MNLPALILAGALVLLPACEKKSTGEKIEDKVNDALDRRPAEKLRDAGEDARDAAKEIKEDLKK